MTPRTAATITEDAQANFDAMIEDIHSSILAYHMKQEMLSLELRRTGHSDAAADLMSDFIGLGARFSDPTVFQKLLNVVSPETKGATQRQIKAAMSEAA